MKLENKTNCLTILEQALSLHCLPSFLVVRTKDALSYQPGNRFGAELHMLHYSGNRFGTLYLCRIYTDGYVLSHTGLLMVEGSLFLQCPGVGIDIKILHCRKKQNRSSIDATYLARSN